MDYPKLSESGGAIQRASAPTYPLLAQSAELPRAESPSAHKLSLFRLNWHARGLALNFALWVILVVPFWLNLAFRLNISDWEFDLIKFWDRFWLVFVVLYGLYLVECFSSPIVSFLANILSAKQMLAFVLKIKAERSSLTFRAESFHFEYAEGSENVRRAPTDQRVVARKVISGRDNEAFEFTSFYDDSGMLDNDINFYKIVKLRLGKEFAPGDENTRAALATQLQTFVDKNRTKDAHLSHEVQLDIPGFKEQLLCIKDEHSGRFVGLSTYIVLSVLLLSWPYRIFIELISFERQFLIKKLVYK